MLTTIIATAGLAEMSAEDEWRFLLAGTAMGLLMLLGLTVLLTFVAGIFWGFLVTPIRDMLRRKA